MAEITYETLNPTPIENVTVQKVFSDGVHRRYYITANEGYVLHDNMLDYYMDYDENNNGIGDVILGFYAGTRTVVATYDFTTNPREFYAVLESEIPRGAKKL